MNRVFIFPGQGSQAVGMGKNLYDNFTVAKDVFDEVDDALSENLSKLIFEGPEEELTQTQNTQPALMAVSMAMVRVLEHEQNKDITQLCTAVAGHSLGQYSAICASGGLSVGECAKILRSRGLFMQSACKEGEGAMAAIIGASRQDLDEVIELANKYGICDVANDNSKDQVVISGNFASVDFAIEKFKEKGVKAIKLKVSSAFHSRLMVPAAEKMSEVLETCKFLDLKVPVIDNVTLELTKSAEFLKKSLVAQISGTVRWRETMDIIATNYDSASEVGYGKVLTGLFKRAYPEFLVG